jgi:hypothetical protein
MEATVTKIRKRKSKPFLEQKVLVFHTVNRKHYNEAMKAIKELCKQWRS